jgi:hypothetical protein
MEKKITVTVEIDMEELTRILQKELIKGDMEDFKIVNVREKTKTRIEPGIDPHDADYYEDFVGLKIHLEK